jgi:ATP-dependent DNA helicase RecQ
MDMMRGYAETTGCRREFLLGYLGERLCAPCGNCDTREAGAAGQPNVRGDDPFPASSRVLHAQWGEGIVMSTESDRLTVLFPREGYRTLSLQAVEQEGLLHPA